MGRTAHAAVGFLFFLSLLLAPIAHAANFNSSFQNSSAHPSFDSVLAYNQLQVPNLSNRFLNASDYNASLPAYARPLTFARLFFITASPSVDGRISSHHPPSIFWSWGSVHNATVERVYDGIGECSGGWSRYTQTGPSWLNSTMNWTLGNVTRSQRLTESSPNPLPTPFPPNDSAWGALQTLAGPNHSALLPHLTLSFSGQLIRPYLYSENREIASSESGPGFFGQICSPSYDTYLINFSTPILGNARFSVESGEPFFFLLSPAGGEQLSFRPQVTALVFSNSAPAQIEAYLNATSMGVLSATKYDYFNDSSGLIELRRTISTSSHTSFNLSSDRPDALFSANLTRLFSQPSSLDLQNRSYAYQLFTRLEPNLVLGENNLTLYLRDDFNDSRNQSFALAARAASGIGGVEAKNISVQSSDERASPTDPNRTEAASSLTEIRIPSSSSTRPASAFFFQAPTPIAALAPLLPLLVVLLLGFAIFSRLPARG